MVETKGFRLAPGESFAERVRDEREDNFVLRAATFARDVGRDWAGFIEKYPEYAHHPAEEGLQPKYNMYLTLATGARRTGQEFSPKEAVAKVQAERREKYRQELTERMYQDYKPDLMKYAEKCTPWSQVYRETDLGPDDQALYDRARREAHTDTLPDAQDPLTQGFLDGFLTY